MFNLRSYLSFWPQTALSLRVLILMIMVYFMVGLPAYADPPKKPVKSVFAAYIDKRCKGPDCVDAETLVAAVKHTAIELSINPVSLLSIVEIESGYRVHASNHGKSVGLSQVQVKYHRTKFRSEDIYDVFDNVRVGALIYKECVGRHKGSRDKAFWCYNGHQTHGMETYVPRVNKSYQRLAGLKLFE